MDDTKQKARLFIGSSIEGKDYAYELQSLLEYDLEPTVWTEDVFNCGITAFDSLFEAIEKFDLAVFLFTPDDRIISRKEEQQAVRDNLIFEFGLFAGKLGKGKSLIVSPRNIDIKIPSDLYGINIITFDLHRNDQNMKAALGPAAHQIKNIAKSTYSASENEDPKVAASNEMQEEAQKLFNNMNYTSAITMFTAAWKRRVEILGEDNDKTIESLDSIILACTKAGDFNDAYNWRSEKLRLWKKKYGEYSLEVAQSLEQLAYTVDHTGDYKASLKYFRDALSILLRNHKENEYEIAYANCGIGYACRQLEDFEGAIRHYCKAVAYIETEIECTDSFKGFAYNGIGMAYSTSDKEKALYYLNLSLELREAGFEKAELQGWALANTYGNIGKVYFAHGEYHKALSYQRKELEIRTLENDNTVSHARSYVAIANTLIKIGDELSEALTLLNKALDIRKQHIGDNNILIAEIYKDIAEILLLRKEYESALEYSFSAYRIYHMRNTNKNDSFTQLKDIYSCAAMQKMNFETWLELRLKILFSTVN